MMLVDDLSVVIAPATLKQQHRYDCSLPTGQTPGKRWFRGDHQDLEVYMGEYGVPEGGSIPIRWRKVYIVDDASAAFYWKTMSILRDNVHKMLDPFWDGLERSCSRVDTVRAKTYHNELRRRYDPKTPEQKTPHYPKS